MKKKATIKIYFELTEEQYYKILHRLSNIIDRYEYGQIPEIESKDVNFLKYLEYLFYAV